MQIKFKDWLIFIFFGINLVVILFVTRFTYNKLEGSILEKTKDQLLSINILKKRHIEHYLTEKREEMEHFIRYADRYESDSTRLMELLFNISEVTEVVILRNGESIFSDDRYYEYVTQKYQFQYPDSVSVYLDEAIDENKSMLHFRFPQPSNDIHIFMSKVGLNEIVLERAGMGTTGESYIINDKLSMQTPSRFFPDSIPETITVNTIGVNRAFDGQTGTDIYDDYRGILIIGAYRTVEFHNLRMVLVTEIDFKEAMEGVFALRNYIIMVTFILIIISFLISLLVGKLLTQPISVLQDKSGLLAQGILPSTSYSRSLIKEVNDINSSINKMISALRHTMLFAKEIGKENFSAKYDPLSEKDELGRAIMEMRNKLIALNQQKVYLEIQRKKDLVNTQETERERIARDIHDGIGPLLTTTKMRISALKTDDETKGELIELIDNTIKEIRSVSRNLMPGVLIDFGPAEAIAGMVEEIRKRTGFDISFQRDLSAETSKIGKEEGIALFRIAQESINNALKHADATEIKISLTEFDEYVSLFIKDNGKGFDKRIIKTSEGRGLRNIEERVNILSGDLYITSDEKGTTIDIEIPLQ